MSILSLLGVWNSLAGSRTNIVCAVYVAVITAAGMGWIDETTAGRLQALLLAVGGVTLRAAIANLGKRLDPISVEITVDEPRADPTAETIDWPTRPGGPPVVAGVLLMFGAFAAAAAADEGVSIIGPAEVQAPGLPCELHLQGLATAKDVAIAWKVFPTVQGVKMIEARDGGQMARLTTIAGTWSIVAAYHINGEPIRFVTHQTYVPGVPYVPPEPKPIPPPMPPEPKPPGPTPPPMPPDPGPQPPPEPKPPEPKPLPAGDFDHLPTRVRDLVNAVNSPNRKAEAGRLADAIEAIAAQISAGTLTGPQNIVNALGAALNANTTAAWDDSRAKMVDALKALYLAGKLKTPAAWASLLREVVLGIRATT